MAGYLTASQFRVRSIMPCEDTDLLEAAAPGFLSAKIAEKSAWIDGRLAKRYATPFPSPVPEIVLSWLTSLVTVEAYLRRGFNPSSAQDTEIINAANAAKDEIREAANSQDGLFDLPLRQSTPGQSGVVHGGPLGYSEPDPYQAFDRQREASRHG